MKVQQTIQRMIDNAMAPFKRRVRTMVMRAIVELVDASKKTQAVQVSRAEDLLDDEVEHFQPFGFSAVPKKDAEAIVLLPGASADNAVVVVIDDKRYRPTSLAEGESCMYVIKNNAGVIRVHCLANGDVKLGTNPSNKLSRADRTDARIKRLEDAFNAHGHGIPSLTVSGSSTTAGSTTGNPTLTNGSTTGADEVYGE